ncbi:FadR/GntR family transcriptional regulator [Microbacterium sp.]|uniref:FadR/GntR family transcriptional regulator n=1 Tax=Microbacterium sp. TaxID=51671 RepID=UPI0039E2BDA5
MWRRGPYRANSTRAPIEEATVPSGPPNSADLQLVPVQRPGEQVQQQLRHAILSGLIGEGERLPSENTLAASFQVSRATIREVLRTLFESGLVVKGPTATSGLYAQVVDHNALSRLVSDRLANVLDVGSVTPSEVADFRDLLEIPSARLAARHRTDADIQALRRIIDDERSIAFDDPAVHTLNAQFHSAVARASGNRVLDAFVTALHRTTHPLAFVQTDEELGAQAVRHHISIQQAIAAGDAATAQTAMRSHLAYLARHSAVTVDAHTEVLA